MTFKTDCPKCKGKKKLKTKVTFSGGKWVISPTKCYKCGYELPGFVV